MLISRAWALLIEWADDSWTIHDVRAETSQPRLQRRAAINRIKVRCIDTDDLRKELDAEKT